jgi:type VI secretion system protein ImpG
MALSAYYEDELAYLRDLGGEFARANPKLSAFLGREAVDPDVERLLEGFAFLVARLRQRLDDELPELSHAIVRLVWPHYLRPIPPLTVLAFGAGAAGTHGVVHVPAGTQVRSRPLDGVSCPFVTCCPVDVLPLVVAGVEFENRPTSARLILRLRPTGKLSLKVLAGGTLRLFFNTERDALVGRTLLLWFLRHCRQIECATDGGDKLRLPQACVRPVGFADQDALLPWPKNTFSGFRLLQEYLTFPAKFLFVELTGLEPIAAAGGGTLTVSVDFARSLPDQFRVVDEHIKLNCVPAINLFAHDAAPIRVDQRKSEYRVLPLGGSAYSLNSIEEVAGYQQGRPERRSYTPFETFRHDLPGEKGVRLYYRERVRPSVVGRGADTYVSFVTRRDELADPAAEVVSIKLKCSNGPIADRLAIGSIDQPTPETPAGVTFSNIAAVSPEIAAPIADNLLWRLIANLARNYGSLADIEALRSVIAAYDFRAVQDAQARRRLELLLESLDTFETGTGDAMMRGIPARMRRIVLSVTESKLGGEAELFLFGSVLDAFFTSYASVNALHQFAVRGSETKAVYEWPMRHGTGKPI